MDRGSLNRVDIGKELADSYRTVMRNKQYGIGVEEFLNQTTMLEEVPPAQRMLLEMFVANKRSALKMSEAMQSMLDALEEHGDPRQVAMFEGAKPTAESVIRQGINDFEKQQAEKTAASERYSLREYSEHEKENWKNSKRIIIYDGPESLNAFLNRALQDENFYGKLYFGKIPDNLADRIYLETNIKTAGNNLSLGASEVRKIMKSHGNASTEKLRGQRAITIDDFKYIVDVIENPDEIEAFVDGYVGRKKSEPNPAINFKKTLPNGKTIVFAYVSDKHQDLNVQTMYGWNKKRDLAQSPLGYYPPAPTPETHLSTASFNNNIPDKVDNSQVKRSERDISPIFYSKMQQEIEGMKTDKIGADSVISYLHGKGVKADEIRWSGIQSFLSGKKSVSKEELLNFVKAISLRIEDVTFRENRQCLSGKARGSAKRRARTPETS